MSLRPAIAFTASSILAIMTGLVPLSSAQTTTSQPNTTIPGVVMTTTGNTTTVTGTGTNTTGTATSTPAPDTATPIPTTTTSGVTGGITGARDAFVLTCIFDVRTTPLSFVVFEASGTGTPPVVAAGMPCSQALGTLLSTGFTLAASLPTFDGATQYTFVR